MVTSRSKGGEWFYEQEISPEGDIPNYNKIMQSVVVFKTNAKAKDADSKSDTLWDSCRTYFVARSKLGTTKRNGQSKCARNAPHK